MNDEKSKLEEFRRIGNGEASVLPWPWSQSSQFLSVPELPLQKANGGVSPGNRYVGICTSSHVTLHPGFEVARFGNKGAVAAQNQDTHRLNKEEEK